MNLGKTLVDLATAPARIGLAVADAGLTVATGALGMAKASLGEASSRTGAPSMAHILGIDDAVVRANRLARLIDDDQPLGRALAPDGPLEQLADVADTLNRLAPGLEALAPTIDALYEAVNTLSAVVNPLSNIADRIPFPGRRPSRRPSSPRPVSSQRVIDHED